MKKIKRKVAAFLIFAMIMAMCVPAFAGTIEVRNATNGKDYTAYKVFDLTYATDGDGVSYTFTKTADNTDLYNYLTDKVTSFTEDSPFSFEETSTDVYNVTLKKDTTTGQDIAGFFKAVIKDYYGNESQADLSSLFGNNYALSVEGSIAKNKDYDLPYGYYYITSSLGSTVTIDSTTPDVKVIDKNQGPNWTTPSTPDDPDPYDPGEGVGKAIYENGEFKTENSVNYGDTVDFFISIHATSYAKELDAEGNTIDDSEPKLVQEYFIEDTLGKGFNEATDIKVTVIQENGTEIDITSDTTACVITKNSANNWFQVGVPFGEKYGSNAIIQVEYKAVANEYAVIGTTGNLNTANFTYNTNDDFDPDNPPSDPGKDPSKNPTPSEPKKPYSEEKEKKTTTYLYALAIQKTDESGAALKGAKFSVKVSDTEYIKGTLVDGVYKYLETTTTPFEFETTDEGLLIIKGIELDDGTEYTLTETVAPKGYNKLSKPISLKATLEGAYTTLEVKKWFYNPDGSLNHTDVTYRTIYSGADLGGYGIDIENKKGTELPATGGAGTTLMIALGSLLFMGTAVVLVSKKRLYNESR